jgi:hypothetical protein
VMNPGHHRGLDWAMAPVLVGVVGLMVRVRSLRQR